MRIIYPLNPLNPNEADEPYQEEFLAMQAIGVCCSLFDFDALDFDEFNAKPSIESDEIVLYRGWMLRPEKYQKLVSFIQKSGGEPLTDVQSYTQSHHIVGWYDACREFTPESRFYSNDSDLKSNIVALGWDAYFVKDYVKSNSTERGSIASSPEEVISIVELIQKYRGDIEGGITVRRVEGFLEDTEARYFVFNGTAYSATGDVPEIVLNVARRLAAPFYSVDIVQRIDGEYRLIEVGDGQVSDKKHWTLSVFAQMLAENAREASPSQQDGEINSPGAC